MIQEFDLEQIKAITPHREPMLLVERVQLVCKEPVTLDGYYTVKGDEFFLQGHFPGNPIVPGVILCEMMAQTCAAFLTQPQLTPLFTSLNNVKFKSQVKPGDTVRTHCVRTRQNGRFHFVDGKVFVGDRLCVSAEFSFFEMGKEQ